MTAIFWDRKKGTPPTYTPHDFFPSPYAEEKKPQTSEELAEQIKAIAQQLGGK